MLQELEVIVGEHLDHAIGTFQNLTPEVLNTPSATGGWSIAQCLWHLNSYSEHYLPHLKQVLAGAGSVAPGHLYGGTWLGDRFARMMDPTTGTMRMKAFKANTPAVQLDAPAVVAAFIAHQEELLALLRHARHRDISRAAVPVSILPWLKLPVGDVLRFLVAHDRRHVMQALRNL